MSNSDADDNEDREIQTPTRIGYCSPPVHSRFKPGQSGNPSGRSKGSQNLKTLFNKVLDEEISLREGADVKKITKAEAIVRGRCRRRPEGRLPQYGDPVSTCRAGWTVPGRQHQRHY